MINWVHLIKIKVGDVSNRCVIYFIALIFRPPFYSVWYLPLFPAGVVQAATFFLFFLFFFFSSDFLEAWRSLQFLSMMAHSAEVNRAEDVLSLWSATKDANLEHKERWQNISEVSVWVRTFHRRAEDLWQKAECLLLSNPCRSSGKQSRVVSVATQHVAACLSFQFFKYKTWTQICSNRPNVIPLRKVKRLLITGDAVDYSHAILHHFDNK